MPDLIFVSDIFLLAVAAVCIIAACITDIRKREVPNWISFSLIAIAVAIRGIAAILSHQASYFYFSLIAIAIFIVVANIFYYGRIFGGGDAKLLIALSAVFATIPVFAKPSPISEPFLLSFTMNIFVFGFAYGILYSFFAAAKNRRAFSREFGRVSEKTRPIKIISWMLAFVVLILSIILFLIRSFAALPVLVISVILFLMPLLYFFTKAVENSSMIRLTRPDDLAEGDILVGIAKLKGRTIKQGVHGLSAQDIIALKKANKKIMIKYGLPFVPVFLIALVCTIFFGDLLMGFVLSLV